MPSRIAQAVGFVLGVEIVVSGAAAVLALCTGVQSCGRPAGCEAAALTGAVLELLSDTLCLDFTIGEAEILEMVKDVIQVLGCFMVFFLLPLGSASAKQILLSCSIARPKWIV